MEAKGKKNIRTIGINKLLEQAKFFQLMRVPIRLGDMETQALVDTGASTSLLSIKFLEKIPLSHRKKVDLENIPVFKSVSGDSITPKGQYDIPITLTNETLNHKFFILDHLDEGCILGIDFLTHFEVNVDIKNRSITYIKNKKKNTIKIPELPLYSIIAEVGDDSISKFDFSHVPEEHLTKIISLLKNHESLFASKMSELGTATMIKHTINTANNPPVKLPLRRTPHTLKKAIKDQVDEMLVNNIIRESTSPYAAPVVMVPKKEGELRFCIDYRRLNQTTIKDSYPLPRIDDTIDALHGAQYFSTLDLFSGYWQIEIEEVDKPKTAFVCEFGQYEFNRMPFGLTNAPATFQRLMNKILKPVLYISTLVYLDDIIVFSKSIDEHIEALHTVFNLLASAGLRLKSKKCEFLKEKLHYLGHIVSREGVAPDDRKIQSILEYPEPRNIKELQSFLGLASYYRKFIRAFTEKAHSLTKLIRKDIKWEWGNDQRDAFECIKSCLTQSPILKYPDFTREFIIHTDASGYGIGAVLAQMQRSPLTNQETEVVIAYSSKHLTDREVKWSTTEKEALAIIHAIDVFKPYLYGRKFTVFTDHKPLEWLMSKAEPSGRLARWALKIQEYDIEIGYRTGKSNQNADSLSRIPLLSIATLSLKTNMDWVEAQQKDQFCIKYPQASNDHSPQGILKDECGKILVPNSKIKEVLENNHDHVLAGHLGVAKTLSRIKRQFTWPSMTKDVKQYVKTCLQCARRKAIGSSKAPLQPLQPSKRVWERIAMDVVGPLPESRAGNRYILVLSDYASRYALTVAMEDQKAITIAEHLTNKIITKYGAPEQILTDQGTNFLSKLIEEICMLFKVKQLRTTSYHPQTDGLVERFNRTLGDMLSCYVSNEPELWDEYLDFVTLAYNTSEQTTLKNNPFYLFYGRNANLPNDIVVSHQDDDDEDSIRIKWSRALELAKENLQKAQHIQKTNYDKGSKLTTYKINDLVLLKSPPLPGKFNPRWNGLFKVIKQLGSLNYEIQKYPIRNSKDKNIIVHSNRLKIFEPRETKGLLEKQTSSIAPSKQKEAIQESNQMGVPDKKKVGRPRKQSSPTERKPSLAPKQSDTRTIHNTHSQSKKPVATKRPVGRPRKNLNVTISDDPSKPQALESNYSPKSIIYQYHPQSFSNQPFYNTRSTTKYLTNQYHTPLATSYNSHTYAVDTNSAPIYSTHRYATRAISKNPLKFQF